MSERLAALIALIAFALLVVGALVTGGQIGSDTPGHVAFQIATGSNEGVYFPVGQAMSQIISHPPGVGRCDTATVCGPAGVILSARTSQGAADNLRSVNAGTVDSGFADGDLIAESVAGTPPFRRRATHLRVMAALFSEDLHLVVAAKSSIRSVDDLRGKRVFLGPADSGGAVRGRAVLTAFGVEHVRLVASDGTSPDQMLKAGRIDAYFSMAGVPLETVKTLVAKGIARLAPIDGEGRDRLVKALPQLAPAVIAAGVYPGTGAIETVGTRAYWITRDSEPDPLIYGVTRALFNPANRGALTASHPSARDISLVSAVTNPPAPLHKGAARYYREMGVLPP
jgi:TRAP transporter TAXI family solute receptor